MLKFLKNLLGRNRTLISHVSSSWKWDGLLQVDGEVPIYAIKRGSKATDEEVKYMLRAGNLEEPFKGRIRIFRFTFEEVPKLLKQDGFPKLNDVNDSVFMLIEASAIADVFKDSGFTMDPKERLLTMKNGRRIKLIHQWAGYLPSGSLGWCVSFMNG